MLHISSNVFKAQRIPSRAPQATASRREEIMLIIMFFDARINHVPAFLPLQDWLLGIGPIK